MLHRHLPKYHYDGSAHFVTTKTYHKTPLFQYTTCANIVLEELAFYRAKKDLKVLGYVVMPDHVHTVLWWDNEKHPAITISSVMQSLKGSIARRIIDEIFEQPISPGSIEHPLDANLDVMRRKLVLSATQVLGSAKHSLRDVENRRHRRNLKYQIWQRGFYDFNVVTMDKLNEKLRYIHNNPVKAGLCEEAEQHPFSSAWYYEGLEKPMGVERVLCPVDEW